MENFTAASNISSPDGCHFALLPHGTSGIDRQSISPGQSPHFGYIPIGLGIETESITGGSSPSASDAGLSYRSWVDDAWSIDNELQPTLFSASTGLENDLVDIQDSSERSFVMPPEECFSLFEEPNGFDEAFGSFCNLSPSACDNLPFRPSEATVEANDECSGFAPVSGAVSPSKCPDDSSKETQNTCYMKQYHESPSINQGPPDIIVTESPSDQGVQPSQSLLRGAMEQTTSLKQPSLVTKPFLQNPIQLHFNDHGKVEFLVRLSLNEVRTQMPMWLDLYWEKDELQKASILAGSRASLPKRKRETGDVTSS
uniref:Uncharacterized protein n=1 Tax=Talaromyces marneffei PM1 TaxID=1077442 RepID=A0A093V3U5_TALMA